MSQFERLTYIDKAARERQSITVDAVARHFEVSVRQIKRDIEFLRTRMKAPLVYDRSTKAYCYSSDFGALTFADEQVLMFFSLVRSLMQNEHYIPIFSEQILEDIASHISRAYIPVSDRISYQVPVVGRIDISTFTTICRGMLTRKRIDMTYLSIKGERTGRRIEAERLINYTGRWYLVAFDLLRSDFRVFHLARIESIAISNTECTGTGTPARERALAGYLESGFGIFMGTKVEKAVIEFSGSAATVVAKQIWHKDQILETGERECEPWTRLTIPVADWTELLGRILSFGASALPLEPASLRQAWARTIREMAGLANSAGM